MRRRDFLAISGAGCWRGCLSAAPGSGRAARPSGPGIAWQRNSQTGLFEQVVAGGEPLVRGKEAGLLDGFCRPSSGCRPSAVTLTAAKPAGQCGAVQSGLSHRLLSSGGAKEDLLEASLTLHNRSDRPETVDVGFQSAARPCQRAVDQQVYVPISRRPD